MDQIFVNDEWRSIDGYINYQVSNIGRVRNSKTGRILKPQLGNDGYYDVGLSKDVKFKRHSIHRLVANEILQKPSNIIHYVVDHIDHDRTNNKFYNLRYATISKNQMNRVKHRTTDIGSKYKGVSKFKNKWRAFVQYQGKRYNLRNYDIEEDAAIAYNKKAFELGGEYAHIKIIRDIVDQ